MPGKKINYIGGDLELDLSLLAKPENNQYQDYFLLNEAKDHVLVSMGRDALKLALLTERLQPGDEVLVPSFLCMKIIDVLEELKLTYRLFDIGEQFEIVSSLLDLVSEKTKAVIFINYFGYSSPDFHLMEAIKGKNKNIAIILDYAQSLFAITQNVLKSSFVDYTITSLRKFLSLPDGAFLFSNKRAVGRKFILPQTRKAVFERGLGKVVKQYCLNLDYEETLLEKLYLDLVYESEKHFDLEKEIYSISALSYALLKRIDFEEVAAKRHQNAQYLYEHFDRTLLPKWDGKSVLLVVPILLREREHVRSALMKQNIYLPVHWPLDERIDRKRYSIAHSLSSRILGLVLDQRYGPEEMRYLVDHFKVAV